MSSGEAAQPAVCLCAYLGLLLPGFPGELPLFLEGRGFSCQKHTEHCSEHSLLSHFYILFILLTLGVLFGWHFSGCVALRETTLLVFTISRFKLCSFSLSFVYHHLSFLATWQFSYLQIQSQTSPRCLRALLPCAAHGFIYKPSKDLRANTGVFVVWSERAVGAGEGTKQSCRVRRGAAPAWGAVPGISVRVTELASQVSAHRSCTGSAVFLPFHRAEAVPSSLGVYLDLKKAF